ncbi:MAG: hypothetical protein AB2417_02730 [Clostridiaceae bacterium]
MYIDLKPLVKHIENSIAVGQAPTLSILKYGDRKDSKAYISSIERKASELGVNVIIQDLKGLDKPELKILELIEISDAILPVSPFSESMEKIIKHVLFNSLDVDNFTGTSQFSNCTGQAVLEILKYLGIGTEKKVTIIGRHIGLEIFKVLLKADYSPTPVHSKTPPDLAAERIKDADVLVSATGVKNLIKKDMVKKGSIIIDVGLGDIEKSVAEIADVTTARDGVGSVTTAILFRNIFKTIR